MSARLTRGRSLTAIATMAALLVGLLLVPLSGVARASGLDTTMYGVASTSLFTFNPTTGAQTALPTPTSFPTAALARQPGSTKLYYYATTATNGKYSVAYYDLADNTNHTLSGSTTMYLPRLAFRPDGTLVGMDSTNTLYTLDPATGNVTGSSAITGVPTGFGGDIAFDGNGAMWVVANSTVYRVPAGATAVSSSIALPDGNAHAGAAFGPGGHLFVTDTQTPSHLYDVDVVARTVTDVGASGSASVSDLASETNRPPSAGPAVTASTAYLTPVSVDGLAGASDPDGDPLTVTAVTGAPAHGTTSINGGTITYTPAAGWSGTDNFTWTISDGQSGSTTNTATITVAKPPPAFTGAAANSTQTVQPGATPAAMTAANPTGGSQTYALVSGSLPPGVTLNSDGSFSGKVSAPGTWTVTISATDSGGSATTTLTITVPNVAPAYTAASTNSDQHVVLNGPAPTALVATDANGDALTYTLTGGTLPTGVTLNPDGTFSGSPSAVGSQAVQVTVTDTHGAATVGTLTLAVDNAPNPTARAKSVSTPADTPATVDLLAGSTDPSGYSLSVLSVSTPSSGSVDLNGGTATYTPAPGTSGDASFTYTLGNGHGGTSTATVSVVVTPTATPVNGSTPAGRSLALDVLGFADGTFTPATSVAVLGAPAHGTTAIRSDGTIVYTPADGFSGPDSLTFQLTDDAGRRTAVTAASISVTPVARDDVASTSAGSAVDIALLTNDSGAFGPGATSLVTDATAGSVTISPSGTARYTPAAGFSGSDTFTYRVTDTAGQQSSAATVTVTVAPVAVADSATVDAGSTAAIPVLSNDLGALSPSTVTVLTGPAHGGTSTDPSTGVVTFTPTPGFSGTDSFTYRAQDLSGQNTAAATVSVLVRPVAQPDSAGVAAGSSVLIPVRGNDLGAVDPASVVVASAPSHGTATPDGNGSITYTPADGWSGPDQLTYAISDGTTVRTAPVSVDVAPVARADSASTPAATPVDVPVLANDLGDLDPTTVQATAPAHGTVTVDSTGLVRYTPAAGWSGPDSFGYTVVDHSGQVTTSAPVTVSVAPTGTTKTLTTRVGTPSSFDPLSGLTGSFAGSTPVVAAAPAHGRVTFAQGSGSYSPDPGYSGPDAFSYTVPDATGTPVTVTVTAAVTPSAVDDAGSTPAGQPTTIAVLDNDHGALDPATVTVTQPGHGSATVTGGLVEYTPAPGFSGADQFVYHASDAAGQSTSASVRLTVTPQAVADHASSSGDPVVVPVLANDAGSFDPTTVSVVAPPGHGTATTAPDGTVRYAPEAGWSGTDTFTYTAADSAQQVTTPTLVTVDVHLPAPVPPSAAALTAMPAHQDITPGGSATFDVLGMNGVTDRRGWRVLLTAQPAHGTVSIVNGVLVYTPIPGYSGGDQLRYTLLAPDGRTATAVLSIDVHGKAVASKPRTGLPALPALPFTGLELGAILTTAAALLGSGAVLVLLGRRRPRRNRS